MAASLCQALFLVFRGDISASRCRAFDSSPITLSEPLVALGTERRASHERIGARNGKDKEKGAARATRRQELTSAPVVASGFRYADAFPGSPAFYGCIVPLAFQANPTFAPASEFRLFSRVWVIFQSLCDCSRR
jgi:hypothetical protein